MKLRGFLSGSKVAICINLFSDFLWKKPMPMGKHLAAGGFGCGSCWKLRWAEV